MRTIFKYPLSVTDYQAVTMPAGAEPLHVEIQGGQLCLWALVDRDADHSVQRSVHIFGTGHPIPPHAGNYVGSAMQAGGALVWHVFVAP